MIPWVKHQNSVIRWFAKATVENLKFIEAKYPTRIFYLMNRQELEEWFRCLSKENKAICSYFDEHDCYTCQRFSYIKGELHKTGFCVARDSKYQPITWEIHEIYLLKNEPLNFYVHIHRTVRFYYLIKKFHFVACKIENIALPKGNKLTKNEKLPFSKMFVRF